MSLNQDTPVTIKLNKSNNTINNINNLKYLGGWMIRTEKDFEIRKTLSWTAMHKMKSIWNSKMKRCLKIRTFKATVEHILLYGIESWTVDESLKRKIDGCYTRLLRMAHCQISEIIKRRRI